MKNALSVSLLAGLLSFATGCTSLNVRPGVNATPVSSATYKEALDRGVGMTKRDQNLRMLQVSDTGSMAPFLGESSILVMEPVKAEKVAAGNIISYSKNGEEKVHQVLRVTPEGVITRGSSNWWSEKVAFEEITGRVTAVLYFDKATLSSPYAGKLPVGYVNEAENYGAGLQILKAVMLTPGQAVKLNYEGPGKYALILTRGAGLQLRVGPKGGNWEHASSVDVSWDGARAGQTRKVSLFDEANPGLGNILLNVSYTN